MDDRRNGKGYGGMKIGGLYIVTDGEKYYLGKYYEHCIALHRKSAFSVCGKPILANKLTVVDGPVEKKVS